MKKIAVSILVLVFLITSSLSYLVFGGGLDRHWPVLGESIKQVRNGFYYPFGFSIEAQNDIRIREGVPFGTQNEGLAQVSLFDGLALVTLLGNSGLTVSGVDAAKAAPKDAPGSAGNATKQSPAGGAFMPGLDTPSSQAAANNRQALDKLLLSDFTGIAFIELYAPMIIRFDGPGVIGNGLRLRLAPQSGTTWYTGKKFINPARLLLFKPEKRRGMESIICLSLPEPLNLEVWLNDHRGYAMGRQTQFSFNRTPGLMETELLSENDNKKLIRWLQMEGVWSGKSQPEGLDMEVREAVRKVFEDSLATVSESLSPDTLAALEALIYEWWMLGWVNSSTVNGLHAPQPVLPLGQSAQTPAAASPLPAANGGNQSGPAQSPVPRTTGTAGAGGASGAAERETDTTLPTGSTQ